MAAIVSTYEAIVAGTNGAAYTPARVERVPEFTNALAPLDSSIVGGPLYYVRPGQETRRLGPSSCDIEGQLPVFVAIALRFKEPTQQPTSGRSDEWGKVQAELAADACFATFGNPTFGLENVYLLEDTLRVDFDDRWIAGWVSVEVTYTVRYLYGRPHMPSDNR